MKKGTIQKIVSNYLQYTSSGTGVIVLLEEKHPYKILFDREDFPFEPCIGDKIRFRQGYEESDKDSEYTKVVRVLEDTEFSYKTEVIEDISMRQISPEYEQDILGEELWIDKSALNSLYQEGDTIYLKYLLEMVKDNP